jgi:drug/metabolite transporter (DMT)-like permease
MLFAGIVAACAQVVLKKSTTMPKAQRRIKFLISGNLLLLLTTFAPTFSLRYIEYKYSSIYASISFVAVLILSSVVLKEKLSVRMLAGCVLIVAGIIVFSN